MVLYFLYKITVGFYGFYGLYATSRPSECAVATPATPATSARISRVLNYQCPGWWGPTTSVDEENHWQVSYG